MEYKPHPIDISDTKLSPDLLKLVERLSANTHDTWASARFADGWRYGPRRDDLKKETPNLVSFDELPESEKEYDRLITISLLKAIQKFGYKVVKDKEDGS